VLPLLKKPGMDKNELANYRPISNPVTISKVLERLALNRLRPQMLESPLYSELQSTYRKGHSTETALLYMLNGVYAAVDLSERRFSSPWTPRLLSMRYATVCC